MTLSNEYEIIKKSTKEIEDDEIVMDYDKEELEDQILREIKTVCFDYLRDSKNIDTVTDEELFVSYDFLINKYEEIQNIKEGMKIKSYSWPFSEIAQSLDEITISSSTKSKSTEYTTVKLTKDINYLLDEIGFCYGIINKIMKERMVE